MFGSYVVCSACKVSYESSDTIISTNCGHAFHLKCILECLYRSNYCPVCKKVKPTTRPIYLSFENNSEYECVVNDLEAKLNDKNNKIIELTDRKDKKIGDMKRLYQISEQWRAELQNTIDKQSQELQTQKEIHCKEIKLQLDEIQKLRRYIEQLEKGNVFEMFNEKINTLSGENSKLAQNLKDTEASITILNHKIQIQEQHYKIKHVEREDINKSKTAATQICKVLKVSQDNERLMEEYESLASDLLKWIKRSMKWLNSHQADNFLAGVEKKLEEYRTYRRKHKPPRVEQKAKLETNFNTLQTKLHLSNRPAYLPTEGKTVGDISNAWKGLEIAEKNFEWLLAETMCLDRLEHFANNFTQLSNALQKWLCNVDMTFDHPIMLKSTLNEFDTLKRRHQTLESNFTSHMHHIQRIASIFHKLQTLEDDDRIPAYTRCQSICISWHILGTMIQFRRSSLNGAEYIVEELSSILLAICKEVPNFEKRLEAGMPVNMETFFCVEFAKHLDNCKLKLNLFNNDLVDVDIKFNTIADVVREQSLVKLREVSSGSENKNTTPTAKEITRKWSDFWHLVTQGAQNLDKETINNNMNQIEKQILTGDSKGISQDQLNKFRSSFNHFDKNRTGHLTPEEFKSCLVSLGKDRQDEMDFQRILAVVDPYSTGYVHFDAFLDFMTRESTDTDTAEQVIDSFRILAADKPYILPDELRRELPPDQAEYCIQRMPPYKGPNGVPGALDYMSFSTALYGETDL